MPSNCEDVTAQMMELLYGELPADARASVDAHVAGCGRCRSELEGFEKTRALARRGLDEAPPARARAAILQAAAAHLAAQAQPAARKPVVPEKVSFWDRLRARWAFPTLATVGAVAVFVVANRVFLNPERTLEPRQAVESQEGAGAQPTPALPAAPAPERLRATSDERFAEEAQRGARMGETRGGIVAPATEAPAPDKKPAAGRRDDDARDLYKEAAPTGSTRGPAKKAKKGEDTAGSFAQPPPARAAAAADKAYRDQPLDRRFAPPPPPREEPSAAKSRLEKAPVARTTMDDAEMDESPQAKRAAPATTASKNKARELMGGDAEKAASAGVASGAGMAGPKGNADGFGSGAAQAAPRPVVVQKQATRAAPAEAPAPAATAPATASSPPPPSPAPVMASKPRAKRSSAEPAAEEGYVVGEAEAKDEKKQSSGRANTNDVLLLRADRLFAEGRWAEAAALYRELLRRDPHGDDAERWRRRLVAAENAEVNEKRGAETAARSRKAAPPKTDAQKAERVAPAKAAPPAAAQ